MIAKLYFGFGFVTINRILSLDCPNAFGGIGDIVIHTAEGNLWTGEFHLWQSEFRFGFGNVVKIETRSTTNENEEEPWTLLWEHTAPFTYADYIHAADLLRNVFC